MGEEEAGENGFTYAGIGAGDKDNLRAHVREFLNTDYTDGTDNFCDA